MLTAKDRWAKVIAHTPHRRKSEGEFADIAQFTQRALCSVHLGLADQDGGGSLERA